MIEDEKNKKIILQRIKTLILNAESMDENLRERIFSKIVEEYVSICLARDEAA